MSENTPSLIFSRRVKDPNDPQATWWSLIGYELVDVTYDPHNRDWVFTYRLKF